jgi:hypothetical protein
MIDGATSLDRGSLVVFLVTMPAGPARDRDDLVLEMELSLLDPAKAKSWLPERVTVEHVRTQRVWRFDAGVAGGWLTSKEPAMVYHPDSVVQPDPAFVAVNVGGEGGGEGKGGEGKERAEGDKGNDGDSSDDYPEKNDDGIGGIGGLPLSLLAACDGGKGGEGSGGGGKGGEGSGGGGGGGSGEEEKPLTIDDALVGQRVEVYWPIDSK